MYSRKVLLSVFAVYYKGGVAKEYACVGKLTPSAFVKKIGNKEDVLVRSSQVDGVVGAERYLITKVPDEGLLCVQLLKYRAVKCSMEKEFFVHMSDQEGLE